MYIVAACNTKSSTDSWQRNPEYLTIKNYWCLFYPIRVLGMLEEG